MQEPSLFNSKEDFLQRNFPYLLASMSALEKELIKLLIFPRKLQDGSPNPEFKSQITTLYGKFEIFINEVLKGIKSFDDEIANFTHDVAETQQVKILKTYSFYLFANRIFCYLDNDIRITKNWQSLYPAIRTIYKSQLDIAHQDGGSIDCYLGSVFITKLQTMLKERAFLKDIKESKDFAFGINDLSVFCLIAANKFIKAQCLMMLYILCTNDETKQYAGLEFLPLYKPDYFSQKIKSLVEKNLVIIENKLLHNFANGILHLQDISSIDTKKITTNRNKAKQKHKNPEVMLTQLRKILPGATLATKRLIDEINSLVVPRLHQPVTFNTIFQRDELIKENLLLHKSCLLRAANVLNEILSIPELKTKNWNSYCEALLQQRDCFNLIVQCDLKLCDLDGSIPCDALQSQKLLQKSIHDIIECEQETKKRDQNLNLFLQKIQPVTNKTAHAAKKLARAQRTRDQYAAFVARTANTTTKVPPPPPATSHYEKLKDDAWDKFQKGEFFEALQRYKQLHNTTEDIYEKISSATCIGDIYKKLLTLYKNKDTNIDFKAEAIKYYRLAQSLALKQRLQLENDVDVTIEAWEEIAKSLGDELDPPEQETKILPVAPKPTTKPSAAPNPDFKEALPKYQTLKKTLPIPNFFEKLRELFKQQGYQVFIAGGYIKDHLLGESPNDIDLVVFDPTFKTDNFNLLNNLHRVLQAYFFCEIRSKKYPIIFLQHGNSIAVEIAPLKINSTLDLSKRVYNQELKIQLLAADAATRDTPDNALFYDFEKIYDFFGGIQDLQQNRIRSIKDPEISFREDPIRIFRMIRAIVRRTIFTPNLEYSSALLVALQQHAPAILLLNKDRCFSEIKKMLFRQNALATWQFLTKYNLQSYFFPSPEDKEKQLFHHLMVTKLFSDLDQRVAQETPYNEIFVYAVLLWTNFSECIEKMKLKKIVLDGATVRQTAYTLLTTPNSCFSIPSNNLQQVIVVWQSYLRMNDLMIADKDYHLSFADYNLASVLGRLISKTLQIIPTEKIRTANYRHGFFITQGIQMTLKETVREHGIVCQTLSQGFCLSIPPNRLLTAKDQHSIIKNLKQNMIRVLGSLNIEYSLQGNVLTVKSPLTHKHRSFTQFLQFIFDNENLQVLQGEQNKILTIC